NGAAARAAATVPRKWRRSLKFCDISLSDHDVTSVARGESMGRRYRSRSRGVLVVQVTSKRSMHRIAPSHGLNLLWRQGSFRRNPGGTSKTPRQVILRGVRVCDRSVMRGQVRDARAGRTTPDSKRPLSVTPWCHRHVRVIAVRPAGMLQFSPRNE